MYLQIAGTSTSHQGAATAMTTSHSHGQQTYQSSKQGPLVISMAGTSSTTGYDTVETEVSNAGSDDGNSYAERGDEPDGEDQQEPLEDEMQSTMAPPAEPYERMKFATFEDAREYYQRYAKYHGFAIYTDHCRILKSTGEYNRAGMRCHKSRRDKPKKGVMVQQSRNADEMLW